MLLPNPCDLSLIVAIVMYERAASPENRLPTLAPSFDSSPSPFEIRPSMTTASSGWLATIVRPVSFSYQRKAGMPSLLPCRRPAWLAGVVGGRSASQPSRR